MSIRSLMILNGPRHLFHDALTHGDSNPFTKRMGTIYGLSLHAAPTKMLRTKHQARANIFKEKVLQPKLGPYMEIEYHIESSMILVSSNWRSHCSQSATRSSSTSCMASVTFVLGAQMTLLEPPRGDLHSERLLKKQRRCWREVSRPSSSS